MFLNTDESSAYDLLHEKLRSNVFILIYFVNVIGCELACIQTPPGGSVHRLSSALQIKSGPREGDTQGERRRVFPSLTSLSVQVLRSWPFFGFFFFCGS